MAKELEVGGLPNLPCNLTWATLLGEGMSCAAGSCTIVEDIFEACCPSGDGFGACAQPFLTALNDLNQKKALGKSLADIAFLFGFNTKVCNLNHRIPHLALLAGGDPNGNVKNCVGTLSLTDEAKAWIGSCVKGAPVVNYASDAGLPRYKALQCGLNWGATPIDCGGTYGDDCKKKACPASWDQGC